MVSIVLLALRFGLRVFGPWFRLRFLWYIATCFRSRLPAACLFRETPWTAVPNAVPAAPPHRLPARFPACPMASLRAFVACNSMTTCCAVFSAARSGRHFAADSNHQKTCAAPAANRRCAGSTRSNAPQRRHQCQRAPDVRPILQHRQLICETCHKFAVDQIFCESCALPWMPSCKDLI